MIDATHTADPGATAGPPADHAGGGVADVPGFALGDEVGRGGMGVVYRARDLALDREVAVKLLSDHYAPGSSAARRFTDEARITAQLQHPGIPPVYHVGTATDGRPFLAMKLIKGDTLDVLLKQNAPLDPLGVFQAVAQAVGYAHAHGVIHRDLKPQNVMVGAFGEVQVMDWGLAKLVAAGPPARPTDDPDATADAGTVIRPTRDGADSATQYGSALGTPAYMPPEQAAGELDKLSPPSDVFGLGSVLCVLLTGRPPFDGDAETARIAAVRGETAAAFARLDGCRADPAVIELCKRCLAFKPADRPADAGAVATAVAGLRRAADDRVRQAEVERGRAEVRVAEQAARRRAVQRWAVGVAGVLLVGVSGTTTGLVRAEFARRAAERAERAEAVRRSEAEAARQAEADQRQKAETARAAEAVERQKAERAKQQAEAKEAEADAVIKFFEERVLFAARPRGQDGGLGYDLTVRQAVTASLPALAGGFKDQPLVEARLRLALGRTFQVLGDPKTAGEQQERALAVYAERLGPDHPSTILSMNNLAVSYRRQGRLEDALRLREEVLAIQRRVFGPDHTQTLTSLANLAVIYGSQGRLADALRLQEDVLAARRRLHGSDDPVTLQAMKNVAVSYGRAGRHSDALRLGEEALAGQLRVFGPDHPATLANRYDLAATFASLDRPADALRLGKETLAGRKRVLGPDHPDTLRSLRQVAAFLATLGRGAEAVPLIDECVARAAGKVVDPGMVSAVIDLRLRHFQKANDPAGCRATAEMWEKLDRRDAGSLYNAACFRAVAAGLYAKTNQPAEAAADADRAMAWLTKAVAAGWTDRNHTAADADLTVLHDRADFQKLLASLPEQAPPPRPVK